MSIRLLISPAGAGKSMWVARQAAAAARSPGASPIICVARPLQVHAMVERLSAAGGALGVRVMTIDTLAAECLTECRVTLPDPGREVTFRILQATLGSIGPRLEHYGRLADRAGLAEALRRLFVELQGAAIAPAVFERTVGKVDGGAHLRDLAAMYTAYTSTLDRLGWSDRPGRMMRAAAALAALDDAAASPGGSTSTSGVPSDAPGGIETNGRRPCAWSHLFVDGFDDLAPSQIALLKQLGRRVGQLDITLTGDPGTAADPQLARRAHRRFVMTRQRLERALDLRSEPLPVSEPTAGARIGRPASPALAHLERTLYTDPESPAPAAIRTTSAADSDSADAAGVGLERDGDREGVVASTNAAGVGLDRDGDGDSGHAPSIELVEVPDRSAEAREALRWIKARIVRDGLRPDEVALLARDLEPYRAAIMGIAAEMRIPIEPVGGMPLASNPAVAALLDLLHLARRDEDGLALMPRRQVVDAWRSPYFDWLSGLVGPAWLAAVDGSEPSAPAGLAVDEGDPSAWSELAVEPDALGGRSGPDPAAIADALDAAARWGHVIEGEAQWREVFDRLESIRRPAGDDLDEREGPVTPPLVPVEGAATALRAVFDAFARRLSPPEAATMRDHVRWIEGLIGPDPLLLPGDAAGDAGAGGTGIDGDGGSLHMVARCRRHWEAGGRAAGATPAAAFDEASIDVSRRDVAALEALKDVLRALVAADEALAGEHGPPPIRFEAFVADLEAGVESASVEYATGASCGSGAVLLADVSSARGLPFRAVAIVGMAEGEFPKTIGESVLLRDADRRRLREAGDLEIEDSAVSAELEYFYEAITRPSERLLLTRPRLADNGALWKASPFWEEVLDRSGVEPTSLGTRDLPAADDAGGPAERLAAAATASRTAALRGAGEIDAGPGPDRDPVRAADWVDSPHAGWRDVVAGAEVIRLRSRRGHETPLTSGFDGELSAIADRLAERYGPAADWSPSRFEELIACGFRFYVGRVLGVAPRDEPAAGLNVAQLGTLYHELLEGAHEAVESESRTDAAALEAALDRIAGPILDGAPERLGFRPTAWWRRTRRGVLETIRATIRALCDPKIVDGFTPVASEQKFGLHGTPPLILADGDETVRIRGVIDRVERAADGRIRIVDYKTAGPSSYTLPKLKSGERLQVAFYALAARDALGLGEPAEGFYWHVGKAEASGLKLSKAEGGIDGAMATAADHAWAAVRAARAGRFTPTPPKGGCPEYCAAAAFCWHYQPGTWRRR